MPVSFWKRPLVSLLKQHGMCTCCPTAQPVHRPITDAPWRHVTGAPATTFHVHRWSGSRDCDGYLERYAVLTVFALREEGDSDDWVDHDAWANAVRAENSAHAFEQHIEITVDPETDKQRATFYESTDEGFRDVSLDGCTRPWCEHINWQRDHTAESMGY